MTNMLDIINQETTQRAENANKYFHTAIADLRKTLNERPRDNATKTLESLLSQSKLIVRALNDSSNISRIADLTRIINWADNALKGNLAKDDQTLNLLHKEIKNESFFDKKMNRIIVNIVKAAAAIAVVGLGLTCIMVGLVVGYTAEYIGLFGMIFTPLSLALIAAAPNSPKSVGREVRELAGFFNPADVEEADEHSVDESEQTTNPPGI